MSGAESLQLFDALDGPTEAALRASIERFGVLCPVVVDQHGRLLDGHHRRRIAGELKVPYDRIVTVVADDDEAREIARTLNADRRHLTADQRRQVVAELRQQGHSLRAIAGATGVSEGQVRKDIDAEQLRTGTQLTPDRVKGRDGRSRPARPRSFARNDHEQQRAMTGLDPTPRQDRPEPAPADKPTPILAADRWTTNAHLIEDVARLGWLRREWRTLDPTYGRGVWWDRWRPDELVCHDLNKLDGVDFRDLPHDDGSFDAAVYDPPYMLMGGRTSLRSRSDFADRFGLIDAPRTIGELETLMVTGFDEVHRCVKPGGFLLAKSATRVSSGGLWSGTYAIQHRATVLGCQLADRFLFISTPIGDPPGTTQHHARQNYSELLVLRKAGAS